MPTFYEIIKVQHTATAAEIETAIDALYNQWRRLVTHHDPNVVDEANRTLRTLEQIRATLTDPDKRGAYDAGIGIGGPVGGLADPKALLRTAAPFRTPPAGVGRPSATQPSSAEPRLDAWECSKCNVANPIGTRHCTKCGHQIGIECSKCGELNQDVATYCAQCGVDIQQEAEAQRREQERQLLRELQTQIEEEHKAIQELRDLDRLGTVWKAKWNLAEDPLYKSFNVGHSVRLVKTLVAALILLGFLSYCGWTLYQVASHSIMSEPILLPGQTPTTATPPTRTVTPPAPPGEIYVGAQVVVTTDGKRLNVRRVPGMDAAIVTRVEPGTRLMVLYGPRTASGYTWWRIKSPDGTMGWAVENWLKPVE